MRFKRFRLWRLSGKAYNFMWKRDFDKKSYGQLQKSEIWKRAKEILIAKKTRNYRKMLKCFFCKRAIKYKQSIVLHHKNYDWNKLFKARYTRFSHFKCHKKFHQENR